MVDFRKKTIGPKDALGSLFRRRREKLGLTLGTVAKRTNVPRHYLSALEEGRYSDLPGVVYGKSFIRVYGTVLGLSVAPLLRAFTDEYTMVKATQRVHDAPKHKAPFVRVLITPLRVRMGLAAVIVLLLGAYIGGEVAQFVRSPSLVVQTPEDQLVTTAPHIVVTGTVDSRASLTVNDMAVGNEEGKFTARVALEQGMNTVRVRAFRRHGKDTVVMRSVIRQGEGISLK